jgi:N-methylhydantoinase A
MYIVAVDTGGTFTDLAAYDAQAGKILYSKSLTDYDDLVEGITRCIAKTDVDISRSDVFKHGTTLVINALLQRNGAACALVTTRGFRDVLEMGRGNRPESFDIYYRRHPALIPREHRFEVGERIGGDGQIVTAPERWEVEELAEQLRGTGVAAVAVCFLNSYANPVHEELVASWLRELLPDIYVTASSELSREWSEFERTATVAANAYVGPQVARYCSRLEENLRGRDFPGRFFLMGSNGGVLGLDYAIARPVALVESGPVGGGIGAAAYADALGIQNLISFDMGGTTAKCALVESGRFEVKSSYYVGGYDRGFPIRSSVIDIVEVGAGGGSIAWLDELNRLHVGPRSAGSSPGPVCYGRGGTEITVTDANLVLGRIDPNGFLGGEMTLDVGLARDAIRVRLADPIGYGEPDGVAKTADGILTIASVIMAGAIKRISVERGRDPREFALFAYGGGGPLHSARIARELHIPLVIIPPEPGNFSAIGMLLADARRDEGFTFLRLIDEASVHEMEAVFAGMEAEMGARLGVDTGGGKVSFERYAEMRYRGQTHSVLTPIDGLTMAPEFVDVFKHRYRARYGHAESKNPVEFVGLRLGGRGAVDRPDLKALNPAPREGKGMPIATRSVFFTELDAFTETSIYRRSDLPIGFRVEGPTLIEEYGSTTVVGPFDQVEVGSLGELRIQIGRAG